MKIILICIILSSTIFPQGRLAIFGGSNFSTIQYNNADLNNQIDISPRNGSSFGVEYRSSRFMFGASFTQRGSKLKQNSTINTGGVDYEIEIGGHEVYDYASAHILYPISMNEQIDFFGGLQIGSSLGGTSFAKLSFTEFNSSQSDEIDMKPKEFGLDAGLQLGLDYMLNHKLGLRASYYMGMTNVRDTLKNSLNFKNNTINLSAIVKLKGLSKKPANEKQATNIKARSSLILSPRSMEVQITGRVGSDTETQSKIAMEYGLRDDITIGISNSNYLNTFDYFCRTNYPNKLIDRFGFHFNLVYHSIISTQTDKPLIIDELDRLKFLHQLIIEYNIKSNVRFRVCPTYLHKNIADTKLEPKGYPWDMWFLKTGLDWFLNSNIEIYGSLIQQMTDTDISQGSQSAIRAGIKYYLKTTSVDLSITNLYHLHGTAIIDDIGINNYSENFRIGFQINKMFN